jgi:choline dehydrogenase-like flavoprotein
MSTTTSGKWDFVVVGSGGGGGTIAWLLAKYGFKVLLLEQGKNLAEHLTGSNEFGPAFGFDASHQDEFGAYMARPNRFFRPRGSYNTFKDVEQSGGSAPPFDQGWVATALGGGSATWGGWAYRALPIDLKLETHFKSQKLGDQTQLDWLKGRGYDVADWPIGYEELDPYYRIAEALFAVSGDRDAINKSIESSEWYAWLKSIIPSGTRWDESHWLLPARFPERAYPMSPGAHLASEIMSRGANMTSASMPAALVHPSVNAGSYDTRAHVAKVLDDWKQEDSVPQFWQSPIEQLWSARRRQPCNMCGYCGGYICWGTGGPKSGTLTTTLLELRDLETAEIRTDAFAYEIVVDPATNRATGVRYLDVRAPDNPRKEVVSANHVIVSGGAVQTARLLFMSGSRNGLGNQSNQLGRNVTFHVFGLTAQAALDERFDGLLHGELGHTGGATSFGPYFLRDKEGVTGFKDSWWKVGTLSNAARKNPLSEGTGFLSAPNQTSGLPLLKEMARHNRAFHIRMTGDDLPHPENRVTLDRSYVDEYGIPVARIARGFYENEKKAMFPLTEALFRQMMKPFERVLDDSPKFSRAALKLVAEHQHGTCRMGDDPRTSVVNRNCQLHEAPNVFVVDTSFMPTGLGLPPMFTVVANALRVGTWITDQARSGGGLN